MSAARRARRQRERDEGPLMRLAMGWTRRMGVDDKLTQTERRVLRRNGLPVEHPKDRTLRHMKTWNLDAIPRRRSQALPPIEDES